jgi:hypothetical protein
MPAPNPLDVWYAPWSTPWKPKGTPLRARSGARVGEVRATARDEADGERRVELERDARVREPQGLRIGERASRPPRPVFRAPP